MQIQAPLPPEGPPALIVDTGVAWQEIAPAIAITVMVVGAILLLLPLVRAWARRIEGRGADPMLADDIASLRDRTHEIDHLNARVQELEERLDFAERLLTQRDPAALPRTGESR